MLKSWGMKKFLAIIVLSLLWCNTGYTELKPIYNLNFEKCRSKEVSTILTAWVDRNRQSIFYTAKNLKGDEFFSGHVEIDKYDENYISTKEIDYLSITPANKLKSRKKIEDYMFLKLTLLKNEKRIIEEHIVKKPTNKKDLKKLNKFLNINDSNYPYKLHSQLSCDSVVVIKDPKPKAVAKNPGKKPDDLPSSNVNHVYCYNPDMDKIIKMESYSKCPGKMIRVKGPNSPKPTVKPKIVDDGRIIKIGSGTGFIVSKEGHIVSNNHVVGVCKKVITNIEGKEINLDIIATDKVNDLGLIKGNINSSNYLSLKKDGAELGEDIVAFGYPLTQQLSDSVKLTKGIVSSLSGMENNYSQIQIDAAIQPGNSGGPVINMSGQVVGVASSGLSKMYMAKKAQYIPENVNFAVASPTLYTFLKANKVSVSSGPSFRSFSTKELAKIGTPATLQLFCMNTKTEYAKLKQAKTHSDMLLDLD